VIIELTPEARRVRIELLDADGHVCAVREHELPAPPPADDPHAPTPDGFVAIPL
jgi:hypothetical protein